MLSVQKNTQKEQEEKVNKENSAFDEYDSEELDQPKSKRTKTESDTEQVSSFSVSEKRKVNVRLFNKMVLVDIREFYTTDDGDTKPGRKGISLVSSQFKSLMDLVPKIQDGIQQVENEQVVENDEERLAPMNPGEIAYALSAKRRITIRKFKTSVLVDIREYYQDSEGNAKPGKKGISLTKAQFEKVVQMQAQINQAMEYVRDE